MFYMLLPTLEKREALIAYLRTQGIQSVFHYLPLHLSTMGQRLGGKEGDCPVTECLSDRLIRLPFSYGLSDAQQEEVISAIKEYEL